MRSFYKNFVLLFCLFFSTYINAQVITSVNPDSAYHGQQNLQVAISGTNLDFVQASSVLVWLKQGNDSLPAYYSEIASPQNLYSYFSFSLSANTGFYDLYFRNTQSVITMLQNGFRLLAAQPAPEAPQLIYPAANAVLNNTIVSFDWNDVQNASEYELIVDNDISFSSPIFNIENLSTSNSFPGVSFYNETYYWKVRAKNNSGLWGNWSSVYIFTITSIPQLNYVNPDNGYAGQTNLGVTITGQNTHFTQGSSTIDFLLKQNAYTITPSSQYTNNPLHAVLNLNIPAGAPVGLYDVHYYTPQDDSITLYNSFYIHGGNQYSGTVFFDANNNQIFDNGEIPYPNGIISVSPLNYYTITQFDGSFMGYVPSGNYALSASNIPDFFTANPSQHTLSFSGSGETDSGNNFALQAIPGIHDLNITLVNDNTFLQPGFNRKTTITVRNVGPVAENGVITYTFPPEVSVDSSSNSTYTQNGNTLTWNYSNLQPFSQIQIVVYLQVSLSAQVGNTVSFNASVGNIVEDYTPNDNVCQLDRVISNSFDPNIKEVFPELGLTPQQATDREYLEYTIHFQNTGNAPAINIRILDTLNAYLDVASFQILAASHAYQVRFLENNLVEFRFNDIYLPDSTSNEPMSHGFIKYKIKPSSSFTTGIDITNTAHIYFDYNEAIVTNTTHTQIITDVNEHTFSQNELSVMPNPFNSTANILYNIVQDGFVEIKLYDYKGQLMTVLFSGKKSKGEHKLLLNGNNLSSGVYFISLVSNGITDFKKVVLINTGRP